MNCHVGPGAGAYLSAKLNGSRQLWLVASQAYHRPIPTPIHNLPPSEGCCQSCHNPDRYIGDVVKVFHEYADDAQNTETKTTVRLHVGGAVSGTGGGIRHSLAHEPIERGRVTSPPTRAARRSPMSSQRDATA